MNMESMGGDEKAKLFRWAGWVMLLLTAFLAVHTLGAIKSLRDVDPVFNSISVTGEGEVVTIPDVATFHFTVSADAANVAAAQNSVTEKMNSILTALKELGIEDKDIKTTDYSVWPKYRYEQIVCVSYPCDPSRQIPDGYTANHTVLIKIRDTEKAGQALAAAGENGATNISGITFTNDDPDAAINQARVEAIADAREKAEALADELDVKLVRVVSYYDNSPNPRVYGYGSDSMAEMKVSAVAPTVPMGENKTSLTVTVVYEIR